MSCFCTGRNRDQYPVVGLRRTVEAWMHSSGRVRLAAAKPRWAWTAERGSPPSQPIRFAKKEKDGGLIPARV
jgi:hypothetical protein